MHGAFWNLLTTITSPAPGKGVLSSPAPLGVKTQSRPSCARPHLGSCVPGDIDVSQSDQVVRGIAFGQLSPHLKFPNNDMFPSGLP